MIYRIFRGRPQNVPLIKAGCDMKRWTWNWDTWQPLCERHVVAKTKLDAQIIISLCVFRQLRASRMAVIWNCKMATHHSLSDERRKCVKCLFNYFYYFPVLISTKDEWDSISGSSKLAVIWLFEISRGNFIVSIAFPSRLWRPEIGRNGECKMSGDEDLEKCTTWTTK